MTTGGSHLKYARALLNTAKKADAEEQVMKDLSQLNSCFRDEQFKVTLKKIAYLEKSRLQKMLEGAFQGKLHRISLNLLVLLARARKLPMLPQVFDAYAQAFHQAKGIHEYTVRTARKLTNDEEVAMIDRLQNKIDKPVHVTFEHNAGLIGGMQIFERGHVTDYSIQNYLQMMKKQMLTN